MPSKTEIRDKLLAEGFVSTFEKLDEMAAYEDLDPIVGQLALGAPDKYDRRRWRPLKANTEFSSLEAIYAKLPARFPPLFERLVLSYRWAEVDLQSYWLLPNPPGPGLGGLLQQISTAPKLWKYLREAASRPEPEAGSAGLWA